jgi:hypothetical protein
MIVQDNQAVHSYRPSYRRWRDGVPMAWLEVEYARERAAFVFQGKQGTRVPSENNDAKQAV